MVQASAVGRIPTTLVDARTLELSAEYVITAIRRRTMRGQSYDGRRFVPYSPGYVATGHTDSQNPDLRHTGALLDSLRVKTTRGGVEVVTNVAYARFVNQKRPFMGVSKADSPEIARIASERAVQIVDRGQK